jgi:hypothetical protein
MSDGLLRRDRDDLELAVIEQPLKVNPASLALSAFNDEGNFHPGN